MSSNSESKQISGVLLGLVEDQEHRPFISITMPGMEPVYMLPSYAGIVFEQLGGLLDVLGYFDKPAAKRVAKKGAVH